MLELRGTKSYLNRELNPQLILEVTDKELGFLGWVVIDRFLSGCAIGGVRMRDGLTLDEVANLAKEMTLKFAFLKYTLRWCKGRSCILPLEKI